MIGLGIMMLWSFVCFLVLVCEFKHLKKKITVSEGLGLFFMGWVLAPMIAFYTYVDEGRIIGTNKKMKT